MRADNVGPIRDGPLFMASLPDAGLSIALFAVFAAVVVGLKKFPVKLIIYLLCWGGALFAFGVLRLFPDSPLYDPGDGLGYLAWGHQIAEAFQGRTGFSDVRQIWPGKGFWSLVIGLTGLLAPTPILLPLMINVIALLVVVLVVQTTFNYVAQTTSYHYVLPLVLVNPGFLMWGPTLMRENFAWLGLSLVGLAIARRGQVKVLRQVLLATLGFALVLAARDDFGAVIVVVTVGAVLGLPFLTATIAERSLRPLASLSFVASLAFISLLTLSAWWFLTFSAVPDGQSIREEVGKKISSQSQLDAVTAVPSSSLAERVVGGFLGPFLRSTEFSWVFVLVACGTVYFGVLLVSAALTIRGQQIQSVNVILSLLISSFILTGILGLLMGNYGALTRLKTGVGILLIPHAAASIQQIIVRWRARTGAR